MRKKLLTLIGSVCLILVLAALPFMAACGPEEAPPPEEEEEAPPEVITWRSQSFLPPLPSNTEVQGYFCEMVKELSGGQLEIIPFAAGEIVGGMEIPEAVEKGVIECGQWWPSYDLGKVPATGIIGCSPMGLKQDDIQGWWYYGGGKELTNRIYNPWNCKAILVGSLPAQICGHWREPVDSLDKMKGKILRVSGLTTEVYEELGLETTVIAGGEVYTAMERGIIDMVEFGDPSTNWVLGLHEVGKYILMPGWHEPASLFIMLINLDAWETLPSDCQRAVELAGRLTLAHSIQCLNWQDAEAMNEMRDYGCVFMRLSDNDLATIDAARTRVLDRFAAGDPLFAEVLQSQRDYLETVELNKSLADFSYKK